jgi:transcriptional regulator with XRE-family HTH domain
MKLCIDYLRQIEAEKGWTRFRMSKELGISSARMYQLYDAGGTYDDKTAFAVARILEIDPGQIIAAAHAERSKDPEIKAIWESLLEKISTGFEALISHATPRRIRTSAW